MHLKINHYNHILALLLVLLSPLALKAQQQDTIHIAYNQMLICSDTIYFGVSDSLIILPEGERYELQRNILLRNNVFYEKKPQKKAQVEERIKRYYALWNKAYSYSTKDTDVVVDNSINTSKIYFRQFEGKVIRSINFQGVDMFEGEVEDTAQNAITRAGQFLNDAHISTREHVLKNNLRFRENERLEAWKMSENERLLRQLDYIEDARIMVKQENLLADSVDLLIITKDKFPFGLRVEANDWDSYSIQPYINNFLGLGDYLEAGLHLNISEDQPWGYNLKYQSRNIAGTFVDAGAYRITNFEKNNYGLIIERPFLTTDMRFGGAFSYEKIEQTKQYKHESSDTVLSAHYQNQTYDFWLGKTFVLSPTAERPNISLAIRTYDLHYNERPEIKADSNLIFHDWKSGLASLMIQKINFFQTQKLFEFGVTEDIPVGYSLKITAGHSWNQYYNRPYLGVDLNTQAVRPQAGLIQISASAGSFYYQEDLEDVIAKMRLNYVSPLKEVGIFEVRHMFFSSCNLLFNERYYLRLNFYDKYMGRIQNNVEGNSTIAMQYKPTFFMPYKILGFKFSAAPFTTLGFMTADKLFSGTGKLYGDIGLTLRTKNESLIFPTFGMDVRFYPEYGNKNNQFTFRFFARNTTLFDKLFSPKPELIRSY